MGALRERVHRQRRWNISRGLPGGWPFYRRGSTLLQVFPPRRAPRRGLRGGRLTRRGGLRRGGRWVRRRGWNPSLRGGHPPRRILRGGRRPVGGFLQGGRFHPRGWGVARWRRTPTGWGSRRRTPAGGVRWRPDGEAPRGASREVTLVVRLLATRNNRWGILRVGGSTLFRSGSAFVVDRRWRTNPRVIKGLVRWAGLLVATHLRGWTRRWRLHPGGPLWGGPWWRVTPRTPTRGVRRLNLEILHGGWGGGWRWWVRRLRRGLRGWGRYLRVRVAPHRGRPHNGLRVPTRRR